MLEHIARSTRSPGRWASVSVLPKITRPSDRARKRLQVLFDGLNSQDRNSLVAFAEFLAVRSAEDANGQSNEIPQPLDLPRPEQESVVAAIRRLSEVYFMIDKSAVLHEAAALVGAHVMNGRPAKDVIDDLEQLFRQAYDMSLQNSET